MPSSMANEMIRKYKNSDLIIKSLYLSNHKNDKIKPHLWTV